MDRNPTAPDLTRNKELVRFALAENSAGLFFWDHQNGEQVWSPEAHGLLGIGPEVSLNSETLLSLIHPEDVASLLDDCKRANDPASGIDRRTSQFRVRTAAGIRWIRSQSFLERDREGKVTREHGIVTDMTRTYALEDRLHSAQRQGEAGLLASSIAHDFNNLLTSVFGELSLCRSEGGFGPVVEASLNSIESLSERAGKLSHQLSSVGQPRSRSPIHLDLNHVISELQQPLERILGRRHQLKLELSSCPLPIYADSVQLGQVVVNLLINARDASPKGDTIVIRTVHSDTTSSPWANLEVIDRGHGIPEDLRSKVFDPYFTTKSEGTGLGLASSLEIVERYAGRLELESNEGAGTTVRACIPLRPDAELEVAAELRAKIEDLPTSDAARAKQGQLVLVLDEDPRGLDLAHRSVRAFDLTPISALDAAQALEIARRHEGELALLVTTLHTPGMDTREFRHRFGAVCPNTPVLFHSESASKGDIRLDDVILDGDGFLLKPSSSATLSRKVRKLLLQQD